MSEPVPAESERTAQRPRPATAFGVSMLVPSAIVVIGLVVAALVWTPYYETNDDAVLNMQAAGVAFWRQPVGELNVVSHVYGALLARAYALLPAVPWYPLAELAALLVAAVVGTATAVRERSSWAGPVVAAAWALAFVVPHAVQLQFTAVAAISAGVGAVRLAVPVRSGRGDAALDVLAAGLIVFGALLRSSAAAFSLLVLCWPLLRSLRAAWRVRCRRRLALAGVVLAAVVVAVQTTPADRLVAFGDDAAQERYRAVRDVVDYGRYPVTEDELAAAQALGWSRNDVEMLVRFWAADVHEHDLDELRGLAAVCRSRVERSGARGAVRQAVRSLRDGAPLLAAFVLLLLVLSPRRPTLLDLAPYGVAFAAVLALTMWLKPPPDRLSWPLFAVLAAWTASRPGAPVDASRRRLVVGALAALALLAAAGARWRALLDWHAARRAAIATLTEDLEGFAARTDEVLVIWRFPFEHLDPWDGYAPMRSVRVLPTTATFLTRPSRLLLEDLDVGPLLPALVGSERLLFVGGLDLRDRVALAIEEHHGTRVEFVPRFEGRVLEVSRVVSAPR